MRSIALNSALLTIAISMSLLSIDASACFLGIGCDTSPQRSAAIEMIDACFGRLTNVYPPNEEAKPLVRGNLRRLRMTCGAGMEVVGAETLYLLPVKRGDQSFLYVFDEKDGKMRSRRFPIMTTIGRSDVIELDHRDYDLKCRMQTNSGGGPEIVTSPLLLEIKNLGTPEGVFRVSRSAVIPIARQKPKGVDDLGPHVTEMILNEAAKDAATLPLLPRTPGFTDKTAQEVRDYCPDIADASVFPSGSESDGSLARIEEAKKRLIDAYGAVNTTPRPGGARPTTQPQQGTGVSH